MRQYISIILGIVLIAGAVMGYKKLANSKKVKKRIVKKVIKVVQTQEVNNTTIPLVITTSGTLKAKDKIDLFTEVQGILLKGSKDFKAGTYFSKGETILRINSEEFSANLRSQKSNFYSVLTAMMPDLQLDFPDAYPKWKTYLANFDMQKSLGKLPETSSDKEKYFITGRKVLSTYYSVKNAEARLSKYHIRTPFSGVLSDAMVNRGALIRPGQKLGTFVNTSIYELEVNINTQYGNLLQKGEKVILSNLEHTKEWTGIVSRINPIVDVNTQTLKVYITLRDKSLKEGMYLEARLPVKSISGAFEVARKLLVEDTKLFVVNDSILNLQNITPVFFNEKTVVVKGLKNGQKLVKEPVPGAYEGMVVKINSKSQNVKNKSITKSSK
jgi:multidrug efflux pump subunit AcrA (membrane-fusion protein)